MNHLAHFRVAWPDPGLIVGGFLGDFVKGQLKGDFPMQIERGIALHRAVDAYTDQHAMTRRSVLRFAPDFRRVGPIMVDVIYDHLLARQWESLAAGAHESGSATSLARFSDMVFDTIDACDTGLPPAACAAATRMRSARSLENYRDEAFIRRSFGYLGSRLKRDNPLPEGFGEFKQNEQGLIDDFHAFYPDLLAFSRRWQMNH